VQRIYITIYFSIGRVVKVDGIWLPSKRSKPFIIAFYHGDAHPDLYAYLSDLIKEIEHLDPSQPNDESNPRSITVKIRAIIADAPARRWLKGTKPHTGYYSCERCKIKGGMIRMQQTTETVSKEVTERGMKFRTMHDPPRKDSEWETYLDVEPGEMPGNNGKIDERMKHRLTITPIDRLSIFGVKPISSFPLEEMHLADGGAFKDVVKTMLKLPKEWKTISKRKRPKVIVNRIRKKTAADPKTSKQHDDRHIKTKDLVALNCRIAVWSRLCTPLEFQRRCRTLVSFKYWKMAESRQFVMYYAIPLLLSQGMTFDKTEFEIFAKLVYGYSLITGNSYKKVPKEDRALSKQLLADFFKLITKVSKRIGSSKLHNFWKHLVDDARRFKCHTTALSAYPFENQVRFFRQVGWLFMI
jgi:hypothetical protein